MLPDEVLEKILSNCDCITIVRCLSISQQFHRVASRFLRLSEFWKISVLQDVDLSTLQDILDAKSLGYLQNLHSSPNTIKPFSPWFEAYVKWFSSRSFNLFHHASLRALSFNQIEISVVKVSGDLIILGYLNGAVKICDYMSSEVQLACQHFNKVTDIALINLTNRSTFSIYKSHMEATSHHHHIVSISEDHTLKIYPLKAQNDQIKMPMYNVRPCKGKLNMVRVFDDKCAVYTHNCKILVWKLMLPNGGPEDPVNPVSAQLINVFSSPDEWPGWCGFWGNKIYTICGENAYLSRYNLESNMWTTKVPNYPPMIGYKKYTTTSAPMTLSEAREKGIHIDTFRKPKPVYGIKIYKAHIYRDGIIFLLTTTPRVLYSTDFSNYKEIPASWLPSRVTAITFWATYLVFGLESGQVLVYSILSKDELENLHNLTPKWTRTPKKYSSVINLAISYHAKGPILTVVTQESLFIYKWFVQSDKTIITR